MKTETILLIGAGIVGYSLLSGFKAGETIQQNVGQGLGQATGQVLVSLPQTVATTTQGFLSGLWNYGYNFGANNEWLNYLITPLVPYQLSKDLGNWAGWWN